MYVYVIIVYEVYLQQNRYENESNVHTIMMHLVQNLRILHTKQIQKKKKEMIIQI